MHKLNWNLFFYNFIFRFFCNFCLSCLDSIDSRCLSVIFFFVFYVDCYAKKLFCEYIYLFSMVLLSCLTHVCALFFLISSLFSILKKKREFSKVFVFKNMLKQRINALVILNQDLKNKSRYTFMFWSKSDEMILLNGDFDRWRMIT